MTRMRRYEFSERLAEILGASRRDLRFRVTMMITEGLAPTGPRGPGAPPATPQFAADSLIGVMAAPQQVHTVEAIRCYRELRPTVVAHESIGPGVTLGAPGVPATTRELPIPSVLNRLRFGDALAWLLDQAGVAESCAMLRRELFGIWVSRGFPVAAVQFAAASPGGLTVFTQRYELPNGGRPPAWLDPDRGGVATGGLFHTVFLPASKLIEIGRLTGRQENERRARMFNLDPTLANLADLVRNRRYRRPWEKFLSEARKARAAVAQVDARAESQLTEVANFGSNPGNLRMFTYVPKHLPAPATALVVVLHGCTQSARSYDLATGWSALADRYGFAVLLPEQKAENNPMRAFNWFQAEDSARESGEPLSMWQMVEWMIANHGIDRHRVYVNGLSAGGAMAAVMLATYPEVFAGGAIIAGLPYRCANGLQEAFECMFQGRSRSAREWGNLVRAASSHQGPWPKVSVWHGACDSTVKPTNAEEVIKQWTNIHGLAPVPTVEATVDGHPYRAWHGPDGNELVEAYTITGMAHGAPIDPRGEGGCGAAAPFILDMGISSTLHIASFLGLTGRRAESSAAAPHDVAEVTSMPDRADDRDSGREVRTESGATNRSPSAKNASFEGGAKQYGGGVAPGFDFEKIIAGFGKGQPGGSPDSELKSGMVPIVDLQKVLTTAFEAAGLLEAQGKASESGGGGQGTDAGTVRGIDIASILHKSFEAAGLLRGKGNIPLASPEQVGGLAASGWQGNGWQLATEVWRGPGDGLVLLGYTSSGKGGSLGNTVRSVSRQFSLGDRPKLSYARRLSLGAAVNILTMANFRVLVDGVVVDEVSAVGMDYDEADWTERTDIDLARFAGRNVILTFEVAANSNIFVEVFAKAWVGGITLQDAPQQSRSELMLPAQTVSPAE